MGPTAHCKHLLGEIVTWDTTKSITIETLNSALESAGLAITMPQMRHSTAFSRAKSILSKELLVRKTARTENGQHYQLTEEEIEGDEANYTKKAKLLLQNSGVVTSDDSRWELSINAAMNNARQYRSAADVSQLAKKIFQNHGDLFAINPRKGVAYFVPIEHEGLIHKMSVFMTRVGGVLHRFPVPRDSAGDESVRSAIEHGLSEMIAELENAAERWADGEHQTREDTCQRACDRWRMIEFKISAYSQYLADKQAELKTSLARAKHTMVKNIKQLGFEVSSEI